MKNKISKAAIINCASILAILFVAFFASHSLVMMGALVTSGFTNPLFNVPVILTGLSMYILLMFYLKEAYVKFVSFKERLIVLAISMALNLISIVLYFVHIKSFVSNEGVIDIMMLVFTFLMLCASILSLVFAKNGKYKEELFNETRYFKDIKVVHYVLFVVFGIFANYSLYAILMMLRTARNITINVPSYLLILVALIMVVFSFIMCVMDKVINKPILKIVTAIINFFVVLLFIALEIIIGGLMIKVAKPICFIDFAISIPILFYLFIIDLIAKTAYLVISSIKK